MTYLEYKNEIEGVLAVKIAVATLVAIVVVVVISLPDAGLRQNVEQSTVAGPLTPEETQQQQGLVDVEEQQKQRLARIEEEIRREKELLTLLVEQRRKHVRALDQFTITAPVGEWSERVLWPKGKIFPRNMVVSWLEAEDIPFAIRSSKGEVTEQNLAEGIQGDLKISSQWVQFRSLGQKPVDIYVVVWQKDWR